jgi:DNA-binding GntR family transcriptional regulator
MVDSPHMPLTGSPGDKLSDAVYVTLRDEVIYGHFDPSERLYPHVLATRFGVSPTPVKEALTRLAVEGFVTAIPRRGFRLGRPTVKRVTDLWMARYGLESVAGELLIEGIQTGSINADALTSLESVQQVLEAGGHGHRWHIEQNAKFHQTLVDLAGSESITNFYRNIRMRLISAWIQQGLSTWRSRVAYERDEHRAILEALRALDTERLRAAIRRHIDRSLQGALQDLAATEANGGG